jgi:CheY-like chemotaxis protein
MSKRILVVEDQKDNRQIVCDMLAGTDYEIMEDGEQALAAVAKQRPDLILMGVQLPTMDGYEVTRQIKAGSRVAIDSDHRCHLPRAEWGRTRQRAQRDVLTMCRSLTVSTGGLSAPLWCVVEHPGRGGQGTGCDPKSRRKALENALERVEYRRELLAGLDAVQAKWAPGTTRPT